MKHATRYLVIVGSCCVFVLSISGCALSQSDQITSTRPACVTLDSYGYVIEQVMNVQPNWELLDQTKGGHQYQWTIQDDSGNHTLSTTLTSDGCVCATIASSNFRMGGGQEETAGLLQGAAVAPVSDLDYTANWLEPRIIFSCGIAYLFRRPYEAESLMEDGTTWTLTCSRTSSGETNNSLYTLAIVAPSCANIIE